MLRPLPPEAENHYARYKDWFLNAKPTKYFFFRQDEDYPEGGLPEDPRLIATLVDSDWGQNILGGKQVLSWGTAGYYVCQTPQVESLTVDATHEAACETCDGQGFDEDENSCDTCNGSGQDFYYFAKYLEAEGHHLPRF